MGKEPEEIEKKKEQLVQALPKILPKVIKIAVQKLVMLFYHISMPPWVTAIKAKKAMDSFKAQKIGAEGGQDAAPQPLKQDAHIARQERRAQRRSELEQRRARRRL